MVWSKATVPKQWPCILCVSHPSLQQRQTKLYISYIKWPLLRGFCCQKNVLKKPAHMPLANWKSRSGFAPHLSQNFVFLLLRFFLIFLPCRSSLEDSVLLATLEGKGNLFPMTTWLRRWFTPTKLMQAAGLNPGLFQNIVAVTKHTATGGRHKPRDQTYYSGRKRKNTKHNLVSFCENWTT